VGGLIYGLSKYWLAVVIPGFQLLIFAPIIIFIIVVFPEGIVGWMKRRVRVRLCNATFSEGTMALLSLENLTKRFGGLVAVDGVNLEVEKGESIGIVGPNGSGKTTLYNVISGVYLADAGKIIFEGKDITSWPPYKRTPLGIGRTFQIPRPFSSASVRENVAVGAMFGTLSGQISVEESLRVGDRYIDSWALTVTEKRGRLLDAGRKEAHGDCPQSGDEAQTPPHG